MQKKRRRRASGPFLSDSSGNLIETPSFNDKKKLEGGDLHYIKFIHELFSPFFTSTTTPLQIFQFFRKQIFIYRHEFV